MPYTLWSKGRLLGYSELDFIANTNEHKMGWFHETAIAEPILDVVTEPARVITDHSRDLDADQLHADLNAAADRVIALELELRSPEGEVLEVKDIGINDTHRLLAFAAECEARAEEDVDYTAVLDELEEEFADDLEMLRFDDFVEDVPGADEDAVFPRYQILVFF